MWVQMTVRDALNSAMDEEMARDEAVFIMGEEVCPQAESLHRRPAWKLRLTAHSALALRGRYSAGRRRGEVFGFFPRAILVPVRLAAASPSMPGATRWRIGYHRHTHRLTTQGRPVLGF